MSGENKKRDFDMGAVRQEVDKMGLKSDHLKTLPVVVKRRLKALENFHKEYNEIESQYRDELDALERKYSALYAPIFEKRSQVVTGAHEPSDAECTGFVAEPDAMPSDIRGVPLFWYYALFNNDTIHELSGLHEGDKEALAALTDIKYSMLPRVRVPAPQTPNEATPAASLQPKEEIKSGFTLTFCFAENPFFSDRELTKTYHLSIDSNGDPMFDSAESTKPQWLPGKNLTVRVVKKASKGGRGRGGRGRGGRGGHGAVVSIEEPCPSFFQFFSPPQLPAAGQEMDPEEFEELSAMVQEDFEVGCEIRDSICNKALLWYTGLAAEEEDDDDDFDEDDYDDEDDDDDDDDDEDDDDEDDDDDEGDTNEFSKPRKTKSSFKSNEQPAENPDCKQQ